MSEPTTRNIRVTPEVMDRWWTRDADGNRLRVEWGEPGADGFYTPTITVDYTDNPIARLREALWEIANFTEDKSAPAIRNIARAALEEGADR